MTQRNGRRHLEVALVAACILLGGSTLAVSQVRLGVGFAVPGLSIGINIPAYPDLVPIPGYPVYYAPGLSANLFFYDGLYWVFSEGNWYYSSWYDGPWYLAEPEYVPDFILRVPILYYRRPPPYFLHWNRAEPPRWGEHWGRGWEDHRRGWDRWDRAFIPRRAPLPSYQRRYPHSRYPGAERQRSLENRYYHYRPSDPRDRSRLERAPQSGRRIAPQPSRPAPERRRTEPPPAHRPPPAGSQRPPTFAPSSQPPRAAQRPSDRNRPPARPATQAAQPRDRSGPPGRQYSSPPARTAQRPSDRSRPPARPAAQPAQQSSRSGPPGRQEQRKDSQAKGQDRGNRPPDRPPG